LSLANADKPAGLVVTKRLRELGYKVAATTGTAVYLAKFGQPVDQVIGKVSEVSNPANSSMENAVDLITRGEIGFVVNTPQGGESRTDGEAIRKAANTNRVASVTTVDAALAAMLGLIEQRGQEIEVRSLQEYHGR
jgi:carbamoyl-phosphate synthase large subunit